MLAGKRLHFYKNTFPFEHIRKMKQLKSTSWKINFLIKLRKKQKQIHYLSFQEESLNDMWKDHKNKEKQHYLFQNPNLLNK